MNQSWFLFQIDLSIYLIKYDNKKQTKPRFVVDSVANMVEVQSTVDVDILQMDLVNTSHSNIGIARAPSGDG